MEFEPLVITFEPQVDDQLPSQHQSEFSHLIKYSDSDFWLFQDFQQHQTNSCLPQFSSNPLQTFIQYSQKSTQNYFQNLSSSLKSPSIQSKKNQKVTAKKSIHHNFQKHTVVTLKKIISLKSLERSSSDCSLIASKMWKIFEKSSEKTRQILSILFGSYKSNDYVIVQKFKQNGFSQIIESQTQQDIRRAQNILRILVCKQLSSLKLTKHLDRRRMSNKENFQLYLKCFRSELMQGPLNLRLKKDKALIIQCAIDTDKYLTF